MALPKAIIKCKDLLHLTWAHYYRKKDYAKAKILAKMHDEVSRIIREAEHGERLQNNKNLERENSKSNGSAHRRNATIQDSGPVKASGMLLEEIARTSKRAWV